ncbi:hypothetical protein Clacol_008469 [Clathrus columnatus]|uniref:Transcription elongation factor n=1 Tax=Clathrus columnatus TaxID=1419009 RepID=A0AAV5AHU7_9AGAM|nr:hypothetical protein Clacol_008469 [Clathrus columnatus]
MTTPYGPKSAEIVELRGRVRVLQAAVSDKDITDVLIWLKKNVVATEALLRETKAGLAVGKLRTHASKSVADLAKDLVKKWKAEVDRAKAKTPGAASTGSNGGTTAPSTTTSTTGSGSETPQPRPTIDTSVRGPSSIHSPLTPGLSTTTTTANGVARSSKTDGIPTDVLHDSVRDKCLQMLYDAVCIDSSVSPAQLHKVSMAIEKSVYTMNGSDTSAAYRAKIRSLYLNLKEKTNPRLRQAVVNGDITPERLCTMTSKEMASDERKEEDKKLSEANFHKALGSEELAAETDAFQCGRCKQRKTRYYQQQTRSADEPMTTFVTCVVTISQRFTFV